MSELQKLSKEEQLAQLVQTNKPMFAFLRCAQGLSKAVMYSDSVIKPGMFYLSDQDESKCIPVGSKIKVNGETKYEVELIVGPWRPHALRLDESNKVVEESFDLRDSVFRSIKADANSKRDRGAMYGIDHLVFIPADQIKLSEVEANFKPEEFRARKAELESGVWAVYFFTKSARNYAFAVHCINEGTKVKMRSTEINWNNYTWWSPTEREVISTENTDVTLEKALLTAFENPSQAEVIETDSVSDTKKVENTIER